MNLYLRMKEKGYKIQDRKNVWVQVGKPATGFSSNNY